MTWPVFSVVGRWLAKGQTTVATNPMDAKADFSIGKPPGVSPLAEKGRGSRLPNRLVGRRAREPPRPELTKQSQHPVLLSVNTPLTLTEAAERIGLVIRCSDLTDASAWDWNAPCRSVCRVSALGVLRQQRLEPRVVANRVPARV